MDGTRRHAPEQPVKSPFDAEAFADAVAWSEMLRNGQRHLRRLSQMSTVDGDTYERWLIRCDRYKDRIAESLNKAFGVGKQRSFRSTRTEQRKVEL